MEDMTLKDSIQDLPRGAMDKKPQGFPRVRFSTSRFGSWNEISRNHAACPPMGRRCDMSRSDMYVMHETGE